jgi:aminopeptidase N
MPYRLLLAFAAATLLGAQTGAAPRDATVVRHDLTVTLDPAAGHLVVTDRITLPASWRATEFALSATLQVVHAEPGVEPVGSRPSPGSDGASPPRVRRYRFTSEPAGTVTLRYEGRLAHPLETAGEEYARGFRQTRGLISEEGVYLAGGSDWYPRFDDGLVAFSLEAAVPEGWHLIAQGAGTSRDEQGRARWESEGATDEIYLVGGPLRVWQARSAEIDTLAYLRSDDEPLAERYLAATDRYLRMYASLIGPYPYSKFALVENFWETGYGMPSFTLLGYTVIRLPFILTSSYPHEILHNWWGNGVYVDYATGNWSEGLTAYLADHLLQEQRHMGDAHRRAALQRYASFVKEERDFALRDFRGRESAATEAVGYGKTMMLFHMLRRELGDGGFRTFLSRFYERHLHTRASFADVERVASEVAGEPLRPFFAQWVSRVGAPVIEVEARMARGADGAAQIEGVIRQTQPGPPYTLRVPVVLQTAPGPDGTSAVAAEVLVSETAQAFTVPVPAVGRPLALHLDPGFDLFRRLHAREIPSSIGQLFGDTALTAVLPARATPAERQAYREMLGAWRSPSQRVEIVTDADLARLPADRSVWLLGRDNRFVAGVLDTRPEVRWDRDALALPGHRIPFDGHSVVVTFRHPADPERAVGWIAVGAPGAHAPLARRLPHYGRYSYLGFTGADAENSAKGEWMASDSPLTIDLRPASERGDPLPAAAFPRRPPLVELPDAGGRRRP